MFVLLSFTPFQPTPGLAIWSLLIFVLFWVIMGKFAFKPIARALEQRESDIQMRWMQPKCQRRNGQSEGAE